jgi:hypothetical protein
VSQIDRLRSLVRKAGDRLGGTPWRAVRQFVAEATRGQVRVAGRDVTRAVAHAPSVNAASVACDAGCIRVDVMLAEGSPLSASFVPLAPRFAPRGAKEITFRIEPADAARHPAVPAVAAALAATIARGLWGMLMPPGDEPALPIVDREDDLVRVDLRTLPAVRALLAQGKLGVMTDLLELGAVEPRDGELRLRLKMPAVGRPR